MQPAKLAAMESHWETGTHVPMYLLTWPDQANRTNSIQALPIPSLLSLLAFNSPSAEVKGLDAFPADDIPPVLPTFLSFRFMVACAGSSCCWPSPRGGGERISKTTPCS